MGTIYASTIMDEAEETLQATGTHWTEAELFGYLNDGQRACVRLKPDVNLTNTAVVLVAGTKQAIPSGGTMLMDIMRNMGTDGSTPGNVIEKVDRNRFDVFNPDWHTATAAAAVEVFMFDEKDPKTFYVYPPQPTSGFGYVEMLYSALPTDIDDTGGYDVVINIDDTYKEALFFYLLYRAYMKDTDYVENANRSIGAYQQFENILGVQEGKERENSPNAT